GSTGTVRTELRLPSGLAIASGAVSCLLNRLQYLPSPRFSTAAPRDRDYALAELQALVASWLRGLGGRVVNPAGARGQAGGPVSGRAWLALAAAGGLPIARSVAATSGRMIGCPRPGERVQLRGDWPGGARGPVPVDVRAHALAGDEETLLV